MRLQSFLTEHGLKMEQLDRCFTLYDEDLMIGSCGRKDNVLKCFAIAEHYQGQALTDLLMTELFKDCFKENIRNLFVYTKSVNSPMFCSYGFNECANTGDVVLLHRGERTPQNVLNELLPSPPADGVTGAIVMNANPFTLGHRYLIEYAQAMVDRLYVFVVQYNGARFSFHDRFFLVQSQTDDLKKVTVLPSTEYSISQATFPSYFLKEKEQIETSHAALDAVIFKRYFLPHFHITIRFLGEEPRDPSTAVYNRMLSETLPPECAVHIIRRKEVRGNIVSASFVRAALDRGNIDEIRDCIPDGTYRFLRKLQ